MSKIIVDGITYQLISYDLESQLEDDLERLQEDIFGKSRIYFRLQKQIGNLVKSKPDGYLIDLTSKKPLLYLIEAELASHDHDHITSQLIKFNTAFGEDRKKIMDLLLEELRKNDKKLSLCQEYVDDSNFTSVDNLIDQICFQEKTCNLIMVIDELETRLELLLKDLDPSPECIEITRYENNGKYINRFDQFKEEEIAKNLISKKEISIKSEVESDTIIVPRNPTKDTENVFITENRWFKIGLSKNSIPSKKYIALYQKQPTSAITHVAKIKNIELWDGGPKYVVNFDGEAQKIGPIKLVPKSENGKVNAPQGRIYANYEKLINAKNLDEVFY